MQKARLAGAVVALVVALAAGSSWLALSCDAFPSAPDTFPSFTSQICGYLEVQGMPVQPLFAGDSGANSGCLPEAEAAEAGVVFVEAGDAAAEAGDAMGIDATAGDGTVEAMPDGAPSEAATLEAAMPEGAMAAAAPSSDAGGPPTIPSTATGVQFVAMVTSPSGQWQLVATASGALATPGGESFTASFTSTGSQIVLPVPLTITSTTGVGSVSVTVGDSTQDFLFTVVTPPAPASVTCIQSGEAGPSTLAWVVEPPAPIVVLDDGGAIVVDGGGPGTLIVDVRDQLINCTGGGVGLLKDMSVSVEGTGGLAAAVTPVPSDPMGFVTYELRGPFVDAGVATAVLSVPSGASVPVSVTPHSGDY
jgi:hypothetical protein